MTRRSDQKLREAIGEIEQLIFFDPDVETVLNKVLTQLMVLLNASFGYVYQCEPAEKDRIPWKLLSCAKFEDQVLKEVKNSCSSHQIPESVKPVYLAGRCVHNGMSDEILEPIPHYHPTIDNYFCIPIIDAYSIHAVIYLCNGANGFEESTASRIRPLLAASNCILRAAKKRQRTEQISNATEQSLNAIPQSIKALINAMFDPVVIANSVEKIVAYNQPAAYLLANNKELIDVPLSTIFPRGIPQLNYRLLDDSDELLPGYSKSVSARANKLSDHSSLYKDTLKAIEGSKLNGDKILFDMSSFKFNHGGQLLRGIVLGNITENLNQSANYHDILQRFQALTHMVPVGILQLNKDWECTYVNDTFCDYCQMSPEELQNTGWLNSVHPDDINTTVVNLRNKAVMSENYIMSFRLQSPLGKVTWVQASTSPIYNEKGTLDGLILALNDITERLQHEQKLQDMAEKDTLTGLTNRAFFNDRIATALKGVGRFGSVALLFLDLDEFKTINDTYGHEVGDQLLKQVAHRLAMSVRRADTIARIGGDEFTILLTNIEYKGSVTAVAEKLIYAFEDPFVIGKHSLYMSCSIGITITDNANIALKSLFKQADVALYNAKESGRNQYKHYSEKYDTGVDLYLQLKQSLKESREQDFSIVYQPQVDARSGEIIGLEALTRWVGSEADQDDAVMPDVFMKVIENSGLINDFSEWLFNTIFKQIQVWNGLFNYSSELSISINLSAKQFRNRDLPAVIYKSCSDFNISPKSVILEMTETTIIEDPELAANTLNTLHSLGFELSLDDFGTGYSSLAYLRSMPFDSVKIDKSFVQDIVDDKDDAEIVSAIIGLANKLNLKVIAEGVHNEEVKEWLINNGCYLHQGFYFFKPLAEQEIQQQFIGIMAPINSLKEEPLA